MEEDEHSVLRAQTFATQAILLGLLARLIKNGRKEDVEAAFEFAEALHTAAAMQDRFPGSKQSATEALAVVYQLRDLVLLREEPR